MNEELIIYDPLLPLLELAKAAKEIKPEKNG